MRKREIVTIMTVIYLVMISGLLLFGTLGALIDQSQSERLASKPAALVAEKKPLNIKNHISDKA